ncbi:MAG: 3'(2'),5'-bisphosphate nucleotidase CysQ [Beijerinckiaceae bacterium]|nr:3'(2'),5'-bisphosphate nucleotidase CysQ [Beijerinckiaceae bacterium]
MADPALPDLAALHRHLLSVIAEATAIAMAHYRPGRRTSAEIIWKEGGSPVTGADLAVDAFLARALPEGIPLAYHSEERPESWQGAARAAYVVDPIDGTRNFMEGGEAWCLVVGVVSGGVPVAGVLAVPAQNQVFSAWRGGGAWLNGAPLGPIAAPAGALRATGPRSALDLLAGRIGRPLEQAAAVPALAHRLLAPVKGQADLALARGGGHDWDIAAAHAILAECGGTLARIDGQPLTYTLAGGTLPPLMAGGTALIDKIRPTLLTDSA